MWVAGVQEGGRESERTFATPLRTVPHMDNAHPWINRWRRCQLEYLLDRSTNEAVQP